MATLQEALKLKKEKGISTRDAIAQIEGNTSTQKPAITPTTPPPTIPTQNFPSQPINQQTTTGVNGENFQVAPVNQQGVTPQAPQSVAPIQPVTPNTPPPTQNVTPTPTTTPEKKIVAPQVDFNVSQGREGEIQKNIADITATNPTLLKDRNAFNQAFGYTTADQGKKAILDSAFQSGQPQIPNADQMFSSIVMKAPVPDDQKTTTQYKIAQNRYLKANSYASMTPLQVSSDITSGKLIEGSQTYEDIKALNPKLIQDTNNLRIVNGSKVSLYSTDAQGNRVNNVEQSFAEDYLGNFGTFLKSLFTVQTSEQIRSAIYTDDVKQAQDKATSIELELNQIEADQAKIEEITRKELEGTGASAERIRLEVGIRQEKLQNQYNSKLKEYNTYANKANNLITQNTTVYQEQMKQQSAQQQALAGAAGQVFSNEMQKENTLQQQQNERQNMLLQESLAQSRASFQTIGDKVYKVQNGQMTDTGIKAEKDAQYQAYGGKLYKIKGDSVTEVPGISTLTPTAPTQDWAKLDDTTLFNQRTGELKRVSASEASAYGPSIVEVTPDAIKGLSSRLSGNNVQCGMVSNDYISKYFPQAKRMGDSYESKVASVESIGVSDVPQVGGVFAMNTYNSNGHTGIVQSVDLANGTFTATDANNPPSQNGGPVTTSTYPISKNFTFSKAPQSTSQIAAIGQFLKDNQERGPGYSEEDVKAFNEKVDRYVKSNDMKGLGLSFRSNVMQNKAFSTDFDNTTKFNSALDTVQKMIDDYEKAGKSTNALNGMAEKVARKLGITTDVALAQLQTQMGFTLANYIKSISGTAASDVEVARLMGNMANISNVKDLNVAIINQVRENGMNTLKALIDTRMYGLPEDLKYSAFEDVYGKKSSPQISNSQIPASIPSNVYAGFESDYANL